MRRRAFGSPDRLGEFDHRGLEPIDADRLLVAGLLLEADVDVVAGLDHLLGRLGEPRLVAIDRRDMEEPGQEGEERHHHQHGDGARMGSGRKIHRARGPGVAITSARLRLADDRHSSPRRPAPHPCSEPAGKCESLQPVRVDLSRSTTGRPAPRANRRQNIKKFRPAWEGSAAPCPRHRHLVRGFYCNRTTMLSVAPLASITVSRTKPGPSG